MREAFVVGLTGEKRPTDDALRHRALHLAARIVDAATQGLAIHFSGDTQNVGDMADAREFAELLDLACRELYFATGAGAGGKESNTSASDRGLEVFFVEVTPILERISEYATPHTVYYLLQLVEFLLPLDPERAFDLAAHALQSGGSRTGFHFESLGADLVVRLVGVFLADHKEIFDRRRTPECADFMLGDFLGSRLAGRTTVTLPAARTSSMNKEQVENEFQVGLRTLLEDIEKEVSPDAPDPYAGGDRQTLLEHTTRIYFFDRFLELLGWRLGIHGDVVEEARVKAGTTTFMDYVGVNPETRVPALMWEAKAWETPFIAPRGGTEFMGSERELIAAAIGHVRSGGEKTKSPATRIWHEFLEQVGGYVRGLKEKSGHALPCAVLASGQWIVVFRSPTVTFLDGDVNDEQFAIFKKQK